MMKPEKSYYSSNAFPNPISKETPTRVKEVANFPCPRELLCLCH